MKTTNNTRLVALVIEKECTFQYLIQKLNMTEFDDPQMKRIKAIVDNSSWCLITVTKQKNWAIVQQA